MISIIVPIYNAEKYLLECLTSIKKQSYDKFEAILVDDGSTDNSAKICKSFVKDDSRFIYTRKKNEGVSKARNYGINISKGEYITFVDSDDIIASDYLLDMVEMISNKVSLVCSGVAFFKNSNDLPKHDETIHNETITFEPNNRYRALYFTSSSGYICSKLYISRIIKEHNIRFDEQIYMCEDLLFNVKYLKKCNGEAVYCNNKNYYYRQYNSYSKDLSNTKWFTIFKALNVIFKDVDEFDYKSKKSFIIFCKDSMIESKVRRYVSNSNSEMNEENILKKQLKKFPFYFNMKLLTKKVCYNFPKIALKIKGIKGEPT